MIDLRLRCAQMMTERSKAGCGIDYSYWRNKGGPLPRPFCADMPEEKPTIQPVIKQSTYLSVDRRSLELNGRLKIVERKLEELSLRAKKKDEPYIIK